MYFSERLIRDRRYLIAAQAVWDAKLGRSYARQVILGSAEPRPKVELSEMRTVGRLRVGDVGALVWVAERLDVVGVINRAHLGQLHLRRRLRRAEKSPAVRRSGQASRPTPPARR